MSRFMATMTLTMFVLLCINEVLLRPINPMYAEELYKHKPVRMKMFSIEENNHITTHKHMNKKYGLSFKSDKNEINYDINNIAMKPNENQYNPDAAENPLVTKSYKWTEKMELPLNGATNTDTDEMKTVEKRFFSAFSRLKSLEDMYRELRERGRHHHVYIFRDGDNQPTLGRSPGAPLRWG